MDLNIESVLDESNVSYQPISKSQKIKLLAKWGEYFPELSNNSKRWEDRECLQDDEAWMAFSKLETFEFFLLPLDMYPSFQCSAQQAPDLRILTDDGYSSCDQVVLLSTDFSWTLVMVNLTTLVGSYFLARQD